MKYSIIIPTYNKFEETIKPCVESLIKYTTLQDTEIIVIANGCTDETEPWIKKMSMLFPNIKLVSSKKALGYTKAVNRGLKVAKGDHIILLNNDTVLLGQSPDNWLDILVAPFLEDPKVGITGPMRTFCEHAGRNFLIFFCVMISKKLYEELGPLDEAFSPGYGEDTDYCCKAEDLGYKVLQVPTESSIYYDHNRMTGNFPIYHAGNVTFKNWPGGEELLKKNNGILRERYNNIEEIGTNVDISKALKCDGYMSEKELTWLADNAKDKDIIIEIGSWHGRSSRALGDNSKGVVYCVDTWNGSAAEQTTGHASAKLRGGDHAFYEFLQNNLDLIQSGKIIPLRMNSFNAACLLSEKGIQADMIFIDAGHTYEEAAQDITLWKPIVKDGGILCGHDYYHHGEAWPGVQQAVDEHFGHKGTDMGYIENNSIWRHVIKKDSRLPCVFDCFIFNNEYDILQERFKALYEAVDRFIIVEATKTHGGKDKPLNFNNNLSRFEPWLNKVTYVVVEDYPALDSWSIERHQRDAIMRALTGCQDNDLIIISDCDEIPNPHAIQEFKFNAESSIRSLEMDLYYYDYHTKAKDKWLEAKILTYGELKILTPCGARYKKAQVIKNAGKHLSYFGGVDSIVKKLEDSAHQEYNTTVYKSKAKIKKAIKEHKDLFDRELKFEYV